MTKNHRNRSWRGQWTKMKVGDKNYWCHKSSLVSHMRGDELIFQCEDKVTGKWDVDVLKREALKLWDEELKPPR